MALNYDNVTAITRAKFIPILADNIFDSSVLLQQFRQRADMLDGGKSITQPLLYAKGRGGSYAEWDTLDVSPKETRTAADYDWKYIYANMTISKQQELKTAGDSAVLNLISVETETTEKTLIDLISTALFNDGAVANDPHGLRKIINYDRSLGGIDSTTYTWWDANVAVDINSAYSTSNLSRANLITEGGTYDLRTVMRDVWQKCQHGKEHPDAVVMSAGMYTVYEHLLGEHTRYMQPVNANVQKVADAGFEVLAFKGVPVLYDEYCPAGFCFFTNSKYLGMKIHQDDNFSLGPWQKPVNQQARIAQVTLACEFVTSNSRYQGRIEAATAVG